jgi:hypothetical protein
MLFLNAPFLHGCLVKRDFTWIVYEAKKKTSLGGAGFLPDVVR